MDEIEGDITCLCLYRWLTNTSCTVNLPQMGEHGGSVVECRTPEREVRGSRPTSAVLCPWARHFTPRKYWLITQEAMAPSRHDWKIVDWDVKPQHNQPTSPRWPLLVRNCLTEIMATALFSGGYVPAYSHVQPLNNHCLCFNRQYSAS